MNTTTTNKNPRTTSKEVKTKIQDYVLSCVSTEDFTEHDGTLKTSLEIICSEFKRVACYENNIKNLKTYQAAFIDWIWGLPTCFQVDYTNYEILDKMASFGLPLPTNKEESQGIDLFTYLVFREFVAVCTKNKVNFWAYCHYSK